MADESEEPAVAAPNNNEARVPCKTLHMVLVVVVDAVVSVVMLY